jgi:molecular chaperone GrpE
VLETTLPTLRKAVLKAFAPTRSAFVKIEYGNITSTQNVGNTIFLVLQAGKGKKSGQKFSHFLPTRSTSARHGHRLLSKESPDELTMMDEKKHHYNTSQQLGEIIEEKQAMNSDSQAQINSNELESEVTEQVTTPTNSAEDTATDNQDNNVAATEASTNDSAASTQQNSPEIESLKTQLEERNSQYVRIAADFENYRKRIQKEKEELEVLLKKNTILELLPVVDNFERARAQIKPQNDGEMNIHKSYQGVYKQLVDSLKRLGVSPMRPEGQLFDPNLHEAVMREHTDEHPEGTVLEELVRGYFLGERVLRHAMVKVAAPKEDVPSSEENQSTPPSS